MIVKNIVRKSTAVAGAAIVLALACTPDNRTAAAGIPIVDDVPTLAPVVDKVVPAVVNIAVSGSVEVQNPLMSDPFFRQFFRMPDTPLRRKVQAAGSGVIVDAGHGYILTNNHVVAVGEEQVIEVTLKDKRHFHAKLVGRDQATDVAVLKIDADNLEAIPFGDSDQLRVGDFALAIGNPFGLGQTVTSGIVSALGRSGLGIEGYEDFIQTDAPINPGNSGGALVDLHGRLIGINTAIVGPSGGNVGIGFAVPSNLAKQVMTDLIKNGEVKRGQIGIHLQDLTPDIAASLGIDQTEGALIAEVEIGSPAAQAGIQAGDLITAVNGKPVRNAAELRKSLNLAHVGDSLDLGVQREGRTARATVTLASGGGAKARGRAWD
jgi:Do/DeqQ family serine protease